MGVRFIREPSETPNISNSDDARMVRYAYGGYDGVVKDKGTELSHTIDGSNFRLNSGVINLMGYEVEVDTNGWVLDVSGVTSRRFYSAYLEINLSLQTAEIKSSYGLFGYPTITTGDDLTANTAGIARLLLYNFIVYNGVVSTVIKRVSVIEYASVYNNQLSNILNGTKTVPNATNAINSTNATNATNLTGSINGTHISFIFESNNETVRNATLASQTGFTSVNWQAGRFGFSTNPTELVQATYEFYITTSATPYKHYYVMLSIPHNLNISGVGLYSPLITTTLRLKYFPNNGRVDIISDGTDNVNTTMFGESFYYRRIM